MNLIISVRSVTAPGGSFPLAAAAEAGTGAMRLQAPWGGAGAGEAC